MHKGLKIPTFTKIQITIKHKLQKKSHLYNISIWKITPLLIVRLT